MPNSCILPHFVTSAVILYGLVWGSTWPLIIATILHSLLPWSPMLLFKLWSQCHGAWHNSSLSVWKFPEGAFFAFCGSAWATFLSWFSLSSGLLLCPFLLCGCAHKKEEPFNLLWVLKNEISTQNESIASTCRAVRTSVSCPNTITQTAIRIIFVCSSVLGFQWSRISQPYLCV